MPGESPHIWEWYFVIGQHPRGDSQLADPVKKFSDTWTGRADGRR